MSDNGSIKDVLAAKKAKVAEEEQRLKAHYEVVFKDRIMNDIKSKLINDEYECDVGKVNKITIDSSIYLDKQNDDTHFFSLYSVIREQSMKSDVGGDFYITLQSQENDDGTVVVKKSLTFKFTL